MTTPETWISDRRSLINAATKGPWWTTRDMSPADVFAGYGSADDVALALDIERPADAALIADSRTSLPKALDALEKVLELHRPVDVWEIDPKNGTWVYRDDERVILTRLCRECTPEFVLEKVEDSEYTPVFHGVEVEWPCPTVTAITTALGVES